MPTADLLNTLVQYAQIVSPLAIVVSAFIYFNQKRKDRKEKAIQIGMEIENLISMIDYVNLIYRSDAPDLVKLLRNADKKKMKKFEYREIREVYSYEELIEIRKYFSLNDTRCCSVGAASRIFVPSTATLKVARKRYHHLFNESISDISENQQNLENSNYLDEYLFFEYHQIVTKVLNRLETLSMMMVQKVADEKAIYNSFSDFFLDFIARFYYYIATINTDLINADKKMKNVIKIFNKWERRTEWRKKWKAINPYYW